MPHVNVLLAALMVLVAAAVGWWVGWESGRKHEWDRQVKARRRPDVTYIKEDNEW